MRELVQRIRRVENDLPASFDDDSDLLTFLSTFMRADELNDVKLALASVQTKHVLDCELACRLKLGKSLVYRNNLKCGTILTNDDICAKVNEPFAISAERFDEFVGKTLHCDVIADENLEETHF